jgi:Aldehyde dehydrogenase family
VAITDATLSNSPMRRRASALLAHSAPVGTYRSLHALRNHHDLSLDSQVDLQLDLSGFASPAVQTGNISIDTLEASVAETPFGGVKDSGYGREGGAEGLSH